MQQTDLSRKVHNLLSGKLRPQAQLGASIPPPAENLAIQRNRQVMAQACSNLHAEVDVGSGALPVTLPWRSHGGDAPFCT